MFALIAAFPVYAGNVNIVIDNQTNDTELEIEVLVDGKSCLLNAGNGFRYNLNTEAKTSQISARCLDDPYGYYVCDYEPEVEFTEDNTIIKITISYSENFGDEGDDSYVEEENITSQTWDPNAYIDGYPDNGYEEFDLSGDAPEKTILIVKCEPVYAFDEVTLTLIDENYKLYEIPLHMDPYFFRAKVTLPAGKYRESGTPSPVFNESASEDASITYAWIHETTGTFGGFIDLAAGQETILDDLKVKSIQDGKTTDTDSRYYFQKNNYEKESEVENKKQEDFRKSAYQSLDLAEQQKPDTTAEEETHWFNLQIFFQVLKVLGVITVLCFGVLISKAIIKQYKENNRRH